MKEVTLDTESAVKLDEQKARDVEDIKMTQDWQQMKSDVDVLAKANLSNINTLQDVKALLATIIKLLAR